MKTTKILISLCVAGLFATTNINAQVRIGSQTTPTKGAVLDLGGTGDTYVGGLKLPNVSLTNTTSMTGLTNSETDLTKLKGLTVYNTNASITGATAKGVGIYYWDGAKWIWMQNNDASTSMNWQLGGNAVTAEQKIGTTSNFDLPFITNNTEKLRIKTNGYVGIGTNNPNYGLHVQSSLPAGSQLVLSQTGDATSVIGLQKNPLDGSNMTYGVGIGGLYFGGRTNGVTANLSSMYSIFRGSGTGIGYSSLHFATTANTRMSIDSIGRVGIGTESPKEKLHVVGNILGHIISGYGGTYPTSTSGFAIGWNTINPSVGACEFVDYAGTGGGSFAFYRVPLLGSPTPSHRIAFIDGVGVYTSLSDSRVKTNTQIVPYGLDAILKLQPKIYDVHSVKSMKNGDVELGGITSHNAIGLIAQEVYKVIPEVVNKPQDESNDLYGISYSSLIPVLIKGIQDQQKIIEQLETRIKALESK